MKRLLIITQKVDADDQLLGFFVEWLRGFSHRFDRVTVLCLERGPADLPPNVHVISLGKDRGASKPRQLWNFYAACWCLRHSYDAAFVHMNPIWVVLGGPLWRLLHKKIILWYTHKSVTWKLRIAALYANTIATASRESFRLRSRKVVVTGHGIDVALFHPDPSRPATDGIRRILTVGRIAPVKDYDTLVNATRILRQQGISFSVTVVGEPALAADRIYEAQLMRKINDDGLTGAYRFIGKVVNRELPTIYQSHDVFVHMSRTGSLDKTMLEALACGMVVVSSNDVARNVLPAAWTFTPGDASELAERISHASPEAFDGPSYVAKHHDLEHLIATLSKLA